MAEEKKATTLEGQAWKVASQELNLANGKTASGEKITLKTAGKWLDRNIEIEAPTAKIDNATIKSGDATVTTVEVGAKTGSSYAVTGSAVVAAPSVGEAGFVSESDGTKQTGEANVNATIDAGELVASISSNDNGSASMTASGFTASAVETAYGVNLATVAGKVKAKAEVSKAGYVKDEQNESATDINVAVDGDGDILWLPEATVAAAASVVTAPAVTVDTETELKTSASATAYSITVKSEATNGSAKAVATTSGVGMVSGTTTNEGTVDIEMTAPADKTVYIAGSEIHVAAKDADLAAYAENTTAIVPSEGYLTIEEGYIPATKIALATLVPDEANITAAEGAAYVLEGKTAYDKDGKLITGTIPTVVAAVSTEDGQKVAVPAGYIAEAQEVAVANGSVSANNVEQDGDFEIAPAATDQTIVIAEGWLEDRTITIKGADNLDSVESAITANDAAATVETLVVEDSDLVAGTVKISGTADIAGTATATTTHAGYSALNDVTCEDGEVSGTATVDATLPLFLGDYILG